MNAPDQADDTRDREPAEPVPPLARPAGFVWLPNLAVADHRLSDRAFRLWVALDKWAARPGALPSNGQLARECGWYSRTDGRPATQKVQAAMVELEKLGLVWRHTAAGSQHRTGIEITRPGGVQAGAILNSIQPVSNETQPPAGPVSNETQAISNSIQVAPAPVSDSTQGLCQIQSGPVSNLTQQRKEKEQEINQASQAPAPAGDLEPFEAEPEPDPEPRPQPQGPPSRREQMRDGFGGCLPGDHEPDEAVLREALAFCGDWFSTRDDFPRGLMLHRRQYPTAWMLKVLRRLVAKGKHQTSGWRLAQHILDEWLANGGPDAGPEDALDDQMRKIPPSQRKPAPAAPGKPRDNPPYLKVVQYTPEQLEHMAAMRAADERGEVPPPPPARRVPRAGMMAEIAATIARKRLAEGGHAV